MQTRQQIVRLVALAGVLVPAVAQATVRSWTNAAGGAAATSTNWSPNGTPVAGDILNYSLAGSYAVSFNASVPTEAQQNFSGGTVSISASSPHAVTQQFAVGLGGNAVLNVTGGAFSVGGTMSVGSSGTGALSVTGPATSLAGTSAAAQLRVGNGATGTLNILDGALVQQAGAVLVGALSSAQGTVTVSGLNGVTHSRLVTTDAAAGDITVGSAGNGSMTVDAGGQVTCADQFSVAPSAGFTGNLSVGTAGTGNLSVAHDFLIGNNATVSASGAGTATIGGGGFVGVTGVTRLGDANGGSGTLDLSAGGQLSTGGLVVDSTNGHLIHTAGTITIFSSPYVPATTNYVLDGAGNPRLFLSNNGTLSPTSIVVGGAQSGELRALSTGAQITTGTGGGITLGVAAGGSGTLVVDNQGSLVAGVNGVLTVGRRGTGTLNVNANGTAQVTNCLIASEAGSAGTVTVNGVNAFLDTLSTMVVGGDGLGAGGAGSLSITGGGRVDVGNGMTVFQGGGAGALTINGSTLNVGTTLTLNQSAMTMTNGVINADLVSINNTDLSASGLINGRIHLASSSTVVTATGPLTLGNAAVTDSISSFGTIDVASQTVTLRDSDLAFPGSISLNGGTLNAPNGTLLGINKTMSGTGTVNNAVSNLGAITATGANGLTFNGLVTGAGQGIGGTRITFGSGGGFTGAGDIGARVNTLDGSTITANGSLSMGLGVGGAATTIGGTLRTSTFTVSLLDAVRPLITGTVEIGGGTLAVPASGVQVKRIGGPIAVIRGSGDISNPLYNNGLVSPGLPAGDQTQTLRPVTLYDQHGISPAAPGTLEIEIEGAGAGECDLVAVNAGSAVLDGTLIVNLINGFHPPVGQEFTILTANSVTGTFPLVIGQGFTVIYSPTSVKVRFIGICDGADFNCDEDLGTDADIEAFFACLAGSCPGLPCRNDADFNNDGDIGTDGDIEAFFRVLAGGACFP